MIARTLTMAYGRARFLPSLLLTALLSLWSSNAWAQTPNCDLAASLDPPSELAASPRDNYNAEFLALAGSAGLAADTLLYELILRDFAAIEALEPGITEWTLGDEETTDSFFLWFETEADRDRAENGEIADYNCLNELLDLSSATYTLPRCREQSRSNSTGCTTSDVCAISTRRSRRSISPARTARLPPISAATTAPMASAACTSSNGLRALFPRW